MKRLAASKLLASFAGALLLGTLAAPNPIPGTFALQTGTAKARAYLRLTSVGSDPLAQRFDIWLTPPDETTPLRSYRVDMTKLLHLIVVSDDFQEYLHIHPKLGADGHFTLDQTFPHPATYHAYADCEPQGLGQQVFRFDFTLGAVPSPGFTGARSLSPSGPRAAAGPYVVSLSTTALGAGKETSVAVHITRDGKPARDLHPYLGALAHAVFLDAQDLTYVHVHPAPLDASATSSMPGMNMNAGGMAGAMEGAPLPDPSPPDMRLFVTLREKGTYKLWLQFRGGSTLYVAPFVMSAR